MSEVKYQDWHDKGIIEMLKRDFPKLTEGEIIYCKNKIRNAIRSTKDNCIDNFRFALDSKGEKYDKIRKSGCCGFFDDVIEMKSGKKLFFGFNYGH